MQYKQSDQQTRHTTPQKEDSMAKCPHCSHEIELVAQKDICEAYGISQSAITQRRAKGDFPEPWDTQGGRLLWLRADMEAFFHDRAEKMIARRIDDLEKIIGRVPWLFPF